MHHSLSLTSRSSPLTVRIFLAVAIAFGMTVAPFVHGTAHAQQTGPRFSVDSTIGTLANDERAKAIVDKYAPGLTSGPHYLMSAAFTVRQIKSRMSGMISDAKFNQMQKELSKLR